MRIRVIDLNTEKEVKLPAFATLLVSSSGDLLVSDMHGQNCDFYDYFPDTYEVSTEFAFSKDDQGEWIWSHSVVYE